MESVFHFPESIDDSALRDGARPYRRRTNGKIERVHRTLAQEWAYAHHYKSDAARAADYQDWIHSYNHHRPHTGIGGKSRIDRAHNVIGNNSKSPTAAV